MLLTEIKYNAKCKSKFVSQAWVHIIETNIFSGWNILSVLNSY